MTVTADLHPATAARPRVAPGLLAFAAGCLLAALVMAPQAWSVWNWGTFLDPDDALRAVEVRDFMAGQAWFDLVPHRLSPDHPFVMHWSRLVDAPLAGLVRAFGLVLSPERAERAMRIAEPLILFGLLLATVLDLVRRLAGGRAMLPAAVVLAVNPQLVTNFLPGHIHHHGLQDTLLLGATAALLRALPPRPKAAFGALAGALAAVSLGVGLQNLPFVVGLATVAASAWIWDGRAQARALAGFGAGLGIALPVFLLDVPPGSYAAAVCDAFSAAHLLAAGATAVVFLVLATASDRLGGRIGRAFAAAVGGAAVLAVEAWLYPACLHDPMSGVDPLLRAEWLSGVGEALPLGRLIVVSWPEGIGLLLTLLIGLGATAAAAWSSPAERPRWLALLLMGGVGFAGTLWQVRVAASTGALLVPGLAWLALRVFDRVSRRPRAPALLVTALVLVFGSGAGWAVLARPLAAMSRPVGGESGVALDPAACSDPASLAPLAELPPGLVLSTIDPGSAILAFTPHTVLAAPYHRDSYGNRVSLLALVAPPVTARPLIADAHVRYLVLCRASNETRETIARHPDSLSAAVLGDHAPDWLRPLGRPGDLYALFAVESGG